MLKRRPRRTRETSGLDWLAFFAAAVQTGFGAFVAIFLADRGWNQGQIGAALTVQTLAQFATQVPGGALVDLIPRRRTLLAGVFAALATGALLLASAPTPFAGILALILIASAGSVLYPGLIALSRAVAGPRGYAERIGRNARWAAIGSGTGAGAMGLVASAVNEQAVLILAALLCLPALWALHRTLPTRPRGLQPGPVRQDHPPIPLGSVGDLLRDRRMGVFVLCVVLFNLASAALLAIASPEVNRRAGTHAGLLVAAFIIVPQIVVAVLAPLAGRVAEAIGRRPVLLLGFATLPLRAASFWLVGNPWGLIPIQVLEGAASAAYGVLVPLIAADLTRTGGRTSLALGVIGLAGALGAAMSTALGGAIAQGFGTPAAYLTLTGFGLAAVAIAWAMMPETRQSDSRQIGTRASG